MVSRGWKEREREGGKVALTRRRICTLQSKVILVLKAELLKWKRESELLEKIPMK